MEMDEPVQDVVYEGVDEKELKGEHEEDESEAEAVEMEGEDEDEDEDEGELEEQNLQGEDRVVVNDVLAQQKHKGKVTLERELGKSFLPFSRVQKIIKADKEIPIVARDAVFLIALATESFITELAAAAQRVAHKGGRATVQHEDIATVVRKADEFMFLEDIMSWRSTDEPEKKSDKLSKPKTGAKVNSKIDKGHKGPTLDKFIMFNKGQQGAEDEMDVVMNEDGTMYVPGETN